MTTLFPDEITTERRLERRTIYTRSLKARVMPFLIALIFVAALIGAWLLDSEALRMGWVK